MDTNSQEKFQTNSEIFWNYQ